MSANSYLYLLIFAGQLVQFLVIDNFQSWDINVLVKVGALASCLKASLSAP